MEASRGIEFAQAFRRFGSQVTVLEPGPRIMAREDIDVTDEVSRILINEGVEIVTGAHATRVEGLSGNSVTVTVETAAGQRKITGSHILSAAGRVPNTADLGLDEAGITLTCSGHHPSG